MITITKEFLIKEYIENEKSAKTIANELKVGKTTILNKLKIFNIPKRNKTRQGIPSKNSRYSKEDLNLKNKNIENLFIIEFVSKKGWKCECKCGNIVYFPSSSILNGDAKSCGCFHNRKGSDSPSWKGYEEIRKTRFDWIINGAKRRNIEFDITIEYIWNLFLEQNRKCKFSGIILYFGKSIKDETTASLDRINSSKGYIEGNLQWIHKDIQSMKMNKTDKEFINWCKIISENN